MNLLLFVSWPIYPCARLLPIIFGTLLITSPLLAANERASATSGEKIPVAVAVQTWTTNQGETYEGSYAGLDESSNVILHLNDDTTQRLAYSDLTLESRKQAKSCNASGLISVLILGDSMSLEGFAKTLDQKLRDDPHIGTCLLYTSPSPRDRQKSRMPSSA